LFFSSNYLTLAFSTFQVLFFRIISLKTVAFGLGPLSVANSVFLSLSFNESLLSFTFGLSAP